jgi:hypothetical protein
MIRPNPACGQTGLYPRAEEGNPTASSKRTKDRRLHPNDYNLSIAVVFLVFLYMLRSPSNKEPGILKRND